MRQLTDLEGLRVPMILLGLAISACSGSGEEELDADQGAAAVSSSCPNGVKQYSPGVTERTDVDSIQQPRASGNARIPSQAFNAKAFSRPVPLVIKMAHHFFPGDSPITGYPHEGLDYSGVGNQKASDIEGQPIHAITGGKVAFVLASCKPGRATRMCGDGWGNQIIIDHGGNVFSRYAHLQTNSALVKVGQEVQAGEKIGKVGMTGYTLGPHLHLEVGIMPGGKSVDACAPTKFAQVYNPWHNLEAVDKKAPALVGPAASSGGGTPEPSGQATCTVSDPDGYTHLRANGAGTAVLASVKKGVSLSVSGTSGDAKKVALEGWVQAAYTSCGTAASCASEVTISDGDPATLGASTGTNLRADVAAGSELQAVVSNGSKASVLSKVGGRLQVRVVGTVQSGVCD